MDQAFFSGSRGARLSVQPWGSAPQFVFATLSTDRARGHTPGSRRSPRSGTETDSRPCHQQRVEKAAIPNQPYLQAQCVNIIMTLDTLGIAVNWQIPVLRMQKLQSQNPRTNAPIAAASTSRSSGKSYGTRDHVSVNDPDSPGLSSSIGPIGSSSQT